MIYNYLKYHLSTMLKKQLLNRQDTLDYLTALKIPYQLHEHEVVTNMKEMAEKVKLVNAPLIKNLVFNDSKLKGLYYVIVAGDTKIEKGNLSIIQVSGKSTMLIPIM